MSNTKHKSKVLLFDLLCPLTLTAGRWSQPSVGGVSLPQISHFSLTKVDEKFIILYGGRMGGGMNRNIYILDAETWVSMEFGV